MKKVLILSLSIVFFASCSLQNDDIPKFNLKYITIDTAIVPQKFTFNKTDTITIKYKLTNSCFVYHNLYYQVKDTTRVVAVVAKEFLEKPCKGKAISKELKIPVKARQLKSYVFKFWKGKNKDGKNIFLEKTIPVATK